ncbi:hypothetical protein KL939_002699 [Ogataea angusta]|nr:hypothetical protein KL939_002699 [Ogataea angusta]
MIRSSQRRERFWAFAGLLKGGKGPYRRADTKISKRRQTCPSDDFFLNFVKYHWLNKPKNTTMPNRVIELQKFYQSTNKPIYMAHPRSKYYLIPYALGLTLSVGASLYYTGRACFGLKAGQ